MKKIIALSLAALMVAAIFAGCESKPATDEPAKTGETEATTVTEATEAVTDEEPLSGGWAYNTEFGEVKLPDDAKAAFDKALGALDGADHEVVAYLGSQIVAGTNYAFVCKTTAVTSEPETTLNLAVVYVDVDGNAEVKDITAIELAPKDDAPDTDGEVLSGGWDVTAAVGAGLDGDAADAFTKALDGLNGASYTPVALLGTQVVAGTNYAVLCVETTVTAEPVTTLAVVYVYAALDGTAEMTTVQGFEF